MKKLFLIDDSLANQISYFHIMLLLATMPFDQFYSHLIFASFTLHTLIHVNRKQWKELLQPGNILLQGIFFLTAFALIYTHYPQKGLTDLTRYLLILLVPVSFSLTHLNFDKYKSRLSGAFALVCTLTTVYLYIHAFAVVRFYKLPWSAIFSKAFVSHHFSEPIGMHATFFSLQLSMAFFYLAGCLFTEDNKYRKYCFTGALILLAGIIQLASKSILFTVITGLVFVVPFFMITRPRARWPYMSIAVIVILCVSAAVLSSATFRTRYISDLKTDLSTTKINSVFDSRLARWQATIQVIKQAPLFGHGAGSELEVLGDQFYSKQLYSAYLNHLNAHNQYLSFLVVTGIAGLLIYIITLYLGFITAINNKNMLFFIFLLLITIVSLSESILNAEKGIYFYSIFFSFFAYTARDKSIPFLNKNR
jgi:O-antigen ligase